MAKTQHTVGFEISVSGRDDGTLEAAYIRFREGKVTKTVEVIEDILLVDYARGGDLLGIEILAPVKISALTRLVEQPRRTPFRRFVKQSVPDDLVLA